MLALTLLIESIIDWFVDYHCAYLLTYDYNLLNVERI